MLKYLYKYLCCCFTQSERYKSFSDHDWTDIQTNRDNEPPITPHRQLAPASRIERIMSIL